MEALDTEIYSDIIKIGKKGQITLPKKLRDKDGLVEDDVLILTRTPSGEIKLRKQYLESPEDEIIRALDLIPPFDAEKAWREVLEERKRERS